MERGMTLYELTAEMSAIEDELYETGGELTPELEKELTETKESLLRKVDSYNALMQKLGAMAESAKKEAERLTKLKKTAENAQKRVKERLLWNMNVFGIEKLEGNLCKMSIRKNHSLEVDDAVALDPYLGAIEKLQKALPEWVTVEVKVSKQAIKEAYKGTDILPAGVSEVSRQSLIIR